LVGQRLEGRRGKERKMVGKGGMATVSAAGTWDIARLTEDGRGDASYARTHTHT
jgi:hypothetical protein